MSVNFTESDLKLLTRAWLCIEGGTGIPKIDYEKLAAQTGFTKGSVGVMWPKLKRKVEAAAAGEGGEDGEAPAATPKKTPKKRTAKEAGATTDATPKKRGRKSKAEIAAAKAAEKGEGSDDEDSKAIVKAEDDGVDKLLSGAKEFSGAGLIGADSDDEV